MLYSGMIDDGVAAWQLADALATANPNKIVTINQTEVAALLGSNNFAFHQALKAALGNDPSVYLYILDGKDAAGNRVSTNSLWDDASRRFAEAATGDVRTLTPLADPTRVFAQTEMAALLSNANVTSIN